MKCSRCGEELDYETPYDKQDGVKKTAMATAISPFYAASLQMQAMGWNEQLNFYVCSECYDALKKDIQGGK